MGCADARESPLLPQGGCAWLPPGTPREGITPGQHQTHDLAGALEVTTGRLHDCLGPRKTTARCRALLPWLDARDPAAR